MQSSMTHAETILKLAGDRPAISDEQIARNAVFKVEIQSRNEPTCNSFDKRRTQA